MGRMHTDFGALIVNEDESVVGVAFRGLNSTEEVLRALRDATKCDGGKLYQPIEFKGGPVRINETVHTRRSLSPVE